MEPVAAALLAWMILFEAISPWQAAGGGVILWGIVMARRGSRNDRS
jgi:drug/metabolite transporter (DMT)-like permease